MPNTNELREQISRCKSDIAIKERALETAFREDVYLKLQMARRGLAFYRRRAGTIAQAKERAKARETESTAERG